MSSGRAGSAPRGRSASMLRGVNNRAPILQQPVIGWECPSCRHQEAHPRTGRVESKLHACPSHGGMVVPLVEVDNNYGINQRRGPRHVVVERGDYVAGEAGLRHIEGRPIMAVRTEHGDGSNDVHVFPAVAKAETRE